MSLKPDDRNSRSRSKSKDRDRSRSRSNVRAPRAPSPPAILPYAAPPPAPYGNGLASPTYEMRSPTSAGAERSSYFGQTRAAPKSYPAAPSVPYPQDDGGFTMGDYKDLPPHERPGYMSPSARFPSAPQNIDEGLAYGDIMSPGGSRQPSFANVHASKHSQQPYPPQHAGSPMSPSYNYSQNPMGSDSRSSSYTYQYAQPPQEITYTAKPHSSSQDMQYSQTPQGQYPGQLPRTYSNETYQRESQKSNLKAPKSPRLTLDTRGAGGLEAPRSAGLTTHMGRLSVSGNRPNMSAGAGDLPPPSPLLEAYHGTYQQISPMPLAIRPDDDDELDELEPLSPQISRASGKGGDKSSRDVKEKKRVKLYDPEDHAGRISKALGRSKVDAETICDVLPGLSHDQIMEMRKEYKKQVKVQGKGVNLSKHLKTKLTGNFGKVAYVTALGRWESEGYWANFWYQSHTSRRELLIESLMGRTNGEIWNIKDEFKDKRYADSLVKCMEKELKMDKFRTAVLMALEERRQEEQDVYPVEYRNQDVQMLQKALTAPKGGESTMLEIIVRRSDAHLREVLKTFERTYQENFPRAALKKSNNLVGEVIAHILNGVINKPARDALLLQHAIKDIAEKNRDDELRYELLISRLVRLHWDKLHLIKVKREYYDRYKKHLEQDIEDSTKGDFAEFMIELCQTKDNLRA